MTGAYLSLYAEDRPGLNRGSGAERMCSCPSPGHEDRKPSCSVRLESGQWFCHGCGDGGGVVKWLRLTRGLPGPEALETARRLGLAPEPRVNGSHRSAPNGQRAYLQPGSVENAPPTALPSRCAACYRYRTPDGTEYARVYRYPENRPGRKADPYTLRTDGEHAGTWTHRAPQKRWPYRIEDLSESIPVVIVEGEKCADALAGLAEGYGVLSWLGGSGAVLRTDWKALAKREVILWPDADGPGREAMARLAGELDRIWGGRGPGDRSGTGPCPPAGTMDRRHRRGRLGMGADPALLAPCGAGRRGRELPAQAGCRAGSGIGRRDRTRSDRVALGALSACRSRDPDGRGSRLRQELPEHGPGGVPVSGTSRRFHRRRIGKIRTADPFPWRTTRPGPSFPG